MDELLAQESACIEEWCRSSAVTVDQMHFLLEIVGSLLLDAGVEVGGEMLFGFRRARRPSDPPPRSLEEQADSLARKKRSSRAAVK
jgi:hypothetical protein